MLITLFALGTFWFWVLVAVHFCVLLALIEYEKTGWATFTMIATFAALYFLGDFNVVAAALHNPAMTAAFVGGYFAAGTAWSVAKWWFFVRRCREDYDKQKIAFLRQNGIEGTVIPDALKAKWKENLGYNYGGRNSYRRGENVIPKAGDHKSRIMTWMCYWPWSMVWTLINDPVKRVFKQIYLQIQGIMQSISNRAFRGVEDDLREPPAPPPAPPAADDEGNGRTRVRRGGAASVD